MQDKDALSTLTWLLDAGADEAMGEEPVNRLKAPMPHPPLEGPEGRARAQARPVGSQFVSAASKFREREQPPSPTPPPSDNDAIGTAQRSAAAASSLADLKAALEAFEGCGLKRGATTTVFADGTPTGGIMFIGEAPGRDEDRAGKPFVGRAGQLLDRMLASIGLSRQTNTYITNVMAWRPPDNRDPTPEEGAMCLPFLRRHIELADPKVIVLLGAVAARHVVGLSEGIMRSRGRWMDYRIGEQTVPLLLTLHPAYLLRQPAHKKLAWRDLQSLAARLESLNLLERRDAVS